MCLLLIQGGVALLQLCHRKCSYLASVTWPLMISIRTHSRVSSMFQQEDNRLSQPAKPFLTELLYKKILVQIVKLVRQNHPRRQSICLSYFFFQLCGVSILRAGETMEPALESVCKDIRIGKILIQTNEDTSEPEVSDQQLISLFDINTMSSRWVIRIKKNGLRILKSLAGIFFKFVFCNMCLSSPS